MSLAKTTGSFPSTLQGTITLKAAASTAYTVGRWVYVGTWGSQTFKAKVVRYNATAKTLVVKNISGVIAEDDSVKERAADGLSDTPGATAAVEAITSTTLNEVVGGSAGGLSINYGGWNLRETTQGIVRAKVCDTSPLRIIAEVLVAQKNLSVKRGDIASIPSFTLTAITSSGVLDISEGDMFTFTITSNEAVVIDNAVTYPFLIGATPKAATYVSSAGNVHTFGYTVVAGDESADADFTVAAGNFTGNIYDVVDGNNVKIAAPAATGADLTQANQVITA
jgi:hypothetical protein